MSTPLLVIAWLILSLALALSWRTARSAWQARSAPEGLMSAFFFGGGIVGYGTLLSRQTFGLSPEMAPLLLRISDVGFLTAPVAVAFFTWLVFRRDANWARTLAWALCLANVTILLVRIWLGVEVRGQLASQSTLGVGLYWLSAGVRAIGFGWACFEASSYWGKARLQVGLGLLDPLVGNRFLLWSCWSGITTVMLVLRVISPMLTDFSVEPPAAPSWLVIAQIVTGLASALTIWLTFAPPGFYRKMIRGTAGTS
jgi:hypothetical protein